MTSLEQQKQRVPDRLVQSQFDRLSRNENILAAIIRPGTIVFDSAPREDDESWLVADGRLLDKVLHPALFRRIGNRYGGDPDLGTFALPDLRLKVIKGADLGSGSVLGNETSETTGTGSSSISLFHLTPLIKT